MKNDTRERIGDLSDEEKIISKKATYHKNCNVHLTLKELNHKTNKHIFERGIIREVGDDFLDLELSEEGQRKSGRKSLRFFFLEIKEIQERKWLNL